MGKRLKTQGSDNQSDDIQIQTCTDTKTPDENILIVGIGASAGGLEALESFLKNVPTDSGMAFVIIQHLDPADKGMMQELLQHFTSMTVLQATDGLKVKPNFIYVKPPDKDISILHGTLYLLEPIGRHGLQLPIDFFFKSLAEDQKERSVGVILSGMGTDGTFGIRAIKEKAGLVLVQDSKDAKFDGMPNSSINTGMVDITALAKELPNIILTFYQHFPIMAKSKLAMEDEAFGYLEKISILLRSHSGNDFSLYKSSTLYRRLERRMGIHKIEKMSSYINFLQENPQELDILFKELLIGVTSFFRDSKVWEELQKKLASYLSEIGTSSRSLRAWVPGCSTGEEAYSLAILFKETIEKIKPKVAMTLQIFATDLDKDSIDKARQGFYPVNIATDVSPERINKFFIREDDGLRVCKDIREMIIFAPQNVITDPPFTKLDILTCRNMLIYFNTELQKKLISLFHYSLNTGGILLLGSAETINNTALFIQLNVKSKIYKRLELIDKSEVMNFPTPFFSTSLRDVYNSKVQKSGNSLHAEAEQVILGNYSPAGVLVNDKGDILYINGKTGKYLEPAAGKVNWNIFAMAREELQPELAGIFWKALREKSTVSISNINLSANKEIHEIKLTVQYINEPEILHGMLMIIFTEHEKLHTVKTRNKSLNEPRSTREILLEKELQQAYTELQVTREEMQTSQEELKSTNEELQSSNEELQSTIEELTTSKEEIQSINEELYTVNSELQSKLENNTVTNNDMKNLLNSTEIATIFLDSQLNVRRFTNEVTKIIKLIPRDVGRAITDITSDLVYDKMINDFHQVVKSNNYIEKVVPSYGGRWFSVRIMPYRTLDNVVDGIVITFLDISVSKELEADLRQKEKHNFNLYQEMKNSKYEIYSSVIENIETPVFTVDKSLKYTDFNKNYVTLMKNIYGMEVEIGQKFLSYNSSEDYKNMKKNISMALKGKLQTNYYKLESNLIEMKYLKIFYNPITNKNGIITGVMVFCVDVGKRKTQEKMLKEEYDSLS